MALKSGTRLGSFVVVSPLGAGGMGEVYRARDEKLDREVAIKVLPASLASDPDALARFEREAKAVAALSHPNILQIHDFGEEQGTVYAVTELLDGETLRERLAAGPLPPRKAAELARQVARGLGAAHEKDVVHRDLKPENLFITKDGRVKILDFGLARIERPFADADGTHTPTQTHLTSPGAVMGTVGYMSPEQVRGQTAEAGSDIFSLGVVIYEMLAGSRAFSRETAAETMAAILNEEPSEIAPTSGEIPAALLRIVHRCMEKRPDERFRSARDLAFALESLAVHTAASGPALPAVDRRARSRLPRLAVAAALLMIGTFAGFVISGWWNRVPEPEPVRLRSITFSGRDMNPAVSPDGKLIAFESDRDGRKRIWLKQVSDGSEVVLTEGPDTQPSFSPDGSSVLFTRAGRNKPSVHRIAVVGGEPRKLIDALEANLSSDGTRLAFTRGKPDGIRVVGVAKADGSEPREITTYKNRRLFGLRWSPRDEKISVSDCPETLNAGCSISLIDPETGDRRLLVESRGSISPAMWAGREDEIFYALAEQSSNRSIINQWKFVGHDLRSAGTQALFWTEDFRGSMEVLGPDTLLFAKGATTENLREFVLEDGVSTTRGAPLTRGRSMDRQPIYTPDGETLVFSSNRTGNLDLWTLSTSTGAIRRLTDDAAADWDPALIDGGKKLLWSSERSGNLEIWMADIDGSGARQISQDGVDAENPTATPDGKWIVYASGNPEKLGVWKIRPDGTDATLLVAGNTYIPDVSPDGRYALYTVGGLAYQKALIRVVEIDSGEEVPFEIEVEFETRPLISPGRARWSTDGRSILFIGMDETWRTGIYRQEFVPGRDTSSTRRAVVGFETELMAESFGISPDGKRMVVAMYDDTNWLVVAEGVPGGVGRRE